MENRKLFAGAEGLARLKVQMALSWHDGMLHHDTGTGDYFRGMVAGLAIAHALDEEVASGIQTIIVERGYERNLRVHFRALDAGPSPTEQPGSM
jgi:hypothetical protein